MKAVRVQYTVQPHYVEQNKKNIKAVMAALKAKPIEGMYYATYQMPDGTSFMHLNMAKDEATMARLNEVEAFQNFRAQLKASKPASPPRAEDISLVGANWEV